MYLHVGNNENIRIRNVIGIFDADSATVSSVTKRFLKGAEAGKSVHFASMELPKSFVLYKDERGGYRICFSQLSTGALAGRIESGIPVTT